MATSHSTRLCLSVFLSLSLSITFLVVIVVVWAAIRRYRRRAKLGPSPVMGPSITASPRRRRKVYSAYRECFDVELVLVDISVSCRRGSCTTEHTYCLIRVTRALAERKP